MLLTLEVRLRLRCPACSGHTVVDLTDARDGVFVCGVCLGASTFDLGEVRRRLAALEARIRGPDCYRGERE